MITGATFRSATRTPKTLLINSCYTYIKVTSRAFKSFNTDFNTDFNSEFNTKKMDKKETCQSTCPHVSKSSSRNKAKGNCKNCPLLALKNDIILNAMETEKTCLHQQLHMETQRNEELEQRITFLEATLRINGVDVDSGVSSKATQEDAATESEVPDYRRFFFSRK